MSSIDLIAAQNAAITHIQNANAARQVNAAAHQASTRNHYGHAPKADDVTLSYGARWMAAAHDAVRNAPDVREQKVAEIKRRLENGTYQVSARLLARKMVAAARYQ